MSVAKTYLCKSCATSFPSSILYARHIWETRHGKGECRPTEKLAHITDLMYCFYRLEQDARLSIRRKDSFGTWQVIIELTPTDCFEETNKKGGVVN